MTVWVYRDGEVVERTALSPRSPSGRSDFPSPMIMNDSTEPLRSMADGKIYTSKSAMRATYRPSGNPRGMAFEEVGNEPPRPAPLPKPDRKAIRESIERGKADVALGKFDHIQ